MGWLLLQTAFSFYVYLLTLHVLVSVYTIVCFFFLIHDRTLMERTLLFMPLGFLPQPITMFVDSVWINHWSFLKKCLVTLPYV